MSFKICDSLKLEHSISGFIYDREIGSSQINGDSIAGQENEQKNSVDNFFIMDVIEKKRSECSDLLNLSLYLKTNSFQ